MSPYTDNYKWQSHTSLKHNEIPWHDAGCQAAPEGARQEKMCRAWTKINKKYWLMGRKSACRCTISMLYKQILKPVWAYGIQLWGCRKQNNTDDVKTRYLRTSMMHLGTSETPTSIGTFKWGWSREKLESSLRSKKKGFTTTSMSKRSSCLIIVNWCEGLEENNLLRWCSEREQSRAQ